MKKIALLGLCTLIFLNAKAQNEPERGKESEQPKVVMYSADASEKKEPFEPVYLLKLNLISALSGDMGLSIEKKLNERFTAEAGLGVTVRNFSQGMIVDFFDVEDGMNYPTISREYKLGPSFVAGLKYYPNGAIDEFFFGPEVRFRRYNSEARQKGERGIHSEYSSLLDFKINFGYINFIEDNIFIEYNAGLGIRSRNQQFLTFEESSSNAILDRENVFAPLISFGLKIGFVAN